MPSANDTIRYSVVNAAQGVNFKATGENFNWDFTKLKSNSQGLYEYKNSTNTPYILSFGFSALGLKIADSIGGGQIGFKNVYNFFKKTTGKWENVGIGFELSVLPLPQAGKHTNTDEIYQFPLNFNDRDSVSFALKIPLTAAIIPIGNYFQDGNRVTTVDGWGTISTPYKSNIECLRIKSVITEMDSMSIAIPNQTPINFKFPNNRVEYKWLSKTEKIPMLEVSGTELNGNFTPTQIRYRDNYISNVNPLAPVADFTADKTVVNKNETVTFSDLSTNTPNSYQWTITPNSFTFINGTSNTSKTPQVQFTSDGIYTVKLTASNLLGTNSKTKTNYITVGNVNEVKNLKTNQLVVYPNPATTQITIETKSKDQEIQCFIFDITGKQISEFTYSNIEGDVLIDISKLASGTYSAIIISNNSIYHSNFTKHN